MFKTVWGSEPRSFWRSQRGLKIDFDPDTGATSSLACNPTRVIVVHMSVQSPALLDGSVVEAPTIVLRRHPRARRYTLRFNREGEVVVTIPRGGSKREAAAFVEEHRAWIIRHSEQRASVSGYRSQWSEGMAILFRGERVDLRMGTHFGRPFVQFHDQQVFIADAEVNLRRPVEQRLVELARRELPERTRSLADKNAILVHSVSVRNQSSRWGSCSERGVISLNWRLVQAPEWVRDYIIVHELMHRRQMNHSIRFWRLVAKACPRWRDAEAWISKNAFELGF